ncbi:MAG: transglycosylase domain-containing protein [Clostridia bacterium]|nr:transglycosylase domain-containing protein [Clostridia bacterium]
MKKRSKQIDWGDEMAVAVRVLGKSILRFFGWILNILMTIGIVGAIVGLVVGGSFLLYVKNYLNTGIDSFDNLAKDKSMTTMVSYVDENGDRVEITSERLSALENRVWVKYSEMNEYLPNAFIAIEDKRFRSHDGVDWYGLTGVAVKMLMGGDMRGASTITQQLIKNVTGDDDVSIQRKAQEIIRALSLEKKYDKEEILEMYLNNIFLSQNCYGVGAAAYTYFGKEVKDLTLIESAAIASITQNPSKWDPILYPENNAERRNYCIQSMYDQGLITREEYVAAYGKELVLNVPDSDETIGMTIHSWYTDAAQQEAVQLLMDYFGYTKIVAEKALLTGGFNIVTAMNPDIQETLEYYFENDADWERADESPIQPECSAVIIDPTNGNVLALVGGRGEKHINLGLNYATQTKRPAGSSIKPLSVYGPGLEYGVFTYGSTFDDVPINFGTETIDPETGVITYSNKHGYPKNAPDKYDGLTTVHYGIRVSKNTIAWRALEAVGLRRSFDFLTKKVGLSTLVENVAYENGTSFTDIAYAPLSMGEFTYGVTVKEMTAAYQIFANGGVYNEERIVLQILDGEGNVIIDNEKKSEIVMSTQTASVMTQMLKEVVTDGTAKTAITLDEVVDCAGKTGTTQANRDKWFVGYTPYYVCGIWFGYSMPQSLEHFSATKTVPMLLWDKIMTDITKPFVEEAEAGGEPLKTLDPAPGVYTATYCMDSGKLMTDACRADPRGSRAEIGYFAAGTEPSQYCDVHIMVNYDKVHNGIATPGCKPENIVQVGLLNVLRKFPFNITVVDAQYTAQVLPPNYSYEGLTNEMPYYQNLLPDGFFSGRTSKTKFYNRVCLTDPFFVETLPPETEPPIPETDASPLPAPDNGDVPQGDPPV